MYVCTNWQHGEINTQCHANVSLNVGQSHGKLLEKDHSRNTVNRPLESRIHVTLMCMLSLHSYSSVSVLADVICIIIL